MLIPDTTTTDYTPLPAGTYPARCTGLIDLGTQTSNYDGDTKAARKVLAQFEILDAETRRNDGTPFTVSKRFTLSKHEKSALRGFLQGWRGRDFTPEEIKRFDLAVVLGQPCLLSVVSVTKDGKTFPNIASAAKLPRGMTAPAGELPLQHFDLTAPDWAVYAQLGSRLQGQIAESPEFQAIPNKPRSIAVPPTPSPAPAVAAVARQSPAMAPAAQPAPPAYATEFAPFGDEDIPF